MSETSTISSKMDIDIYLKDIRKLTVLTNKKEKQLIEDMKNPNITKEEYENIEKQLVEGNLRFVIKVAKEYQNQGIDLCDLVSEGNYGLVRALKNFDNTKGIRFMSYAVFWIRQAILQSLNEDSRTIKIPVNLSQELQRFKKRFDIGKKEEELVNSEEEDKIMLLPTTSNIDANIPEDGDTLLDILADKNSEMPDQELLDNVVEHKDELTKILNLLDYREKIIIEEYFGLFGDEKTLEEIGNILDLTKERVRQIKERAIRKLRNNSERLIDLIK